jgi:hypothetical protein
MKQFSWPRVRLCSPPNGGHKSFKFLCMLAAISSTPFGLALLFFPEATTASYGVSGWNPGTTGVARLYGVALLYVAAVAYAVRSAEDAVLQRRWAMANSAVSVVAFLLSLQLAVSGAVNAVGWSTVLIWFFWSVSWFVVGRRAA